VKLGEFPFLADENFDPEVVTYLRDLGWNVLGASEAGMLGKSDAEVAQAAVVSGRAILTHDRDFGAIFVLRDQRLPGLVYIRPGHIRAAFTIATLEVLIAQDRDLSPGFIVVAIRRGDEVRIRFRQQ
jgi:predicted nuclease of predicted toxin-antitoxin system